MKIILNVLDIISESRFVLQLFEATKNLVPTGVLCSLCIQYITVKDFIAEGRVCGFRICI